MSSNDQSPSFVLDQSGSSRIHDSPNFPTRRQTDEMTNDRRERASPKKYGKDKLRCCITAKHVKYLKFKLSNPDGEWKGSSTEKHMSMVSFMLDEDEDLCDKTGKKIVVCEQYHDLLVCVHGQSNHGGRDKCVDHFTTDKRYSHISSYGITKEMFNEFNCHCPHFQCEAKRRLRGPRANTGKPPKRVAKALTEIKRNRVSKNRAPVAARPGAMRDLVAMVAIEFEGIYAGDTETGYLNEEGWQPLPISCNAPQLPSPPPDCQQLFSTPYNIQQLPSPPCHSQQEFSASYLEQPSFANTGAYVMRDRIGDEAGFVATHDDNAQCGVGPSVYTDDVSPQWPMPSANGHGGFQDPYQFSDEHINSRKGEIAGNNSILQPCDGVQSQSQGQGPEDDMRWLDRLSQ